MGEVKNENTGQAGPARNPARLYILIAAVLLVVIVIVAILLITKGIPALKGESEPTAAAEVTPTVTPVPTFTPGPTRAPTDTPPPSPSPTAPPPFMSDTDTPLYAFESAGARPGVEWTGFFGYVLDEAGMPLLGVPLIVWYRDGQPASAITYSGDNGSYEIRLADAPLAGTWSIQVLTDDGQPASKLFTFNTDMNTESGIQQIQVIWKRVP